MDTEEGDQEDPLSLHKYLYCSANPANLRDPSGHDGDEISLLGAMQTFAYMVGNLAIRAAPAMMRVTIVLFEATTGETIAVGGGAAITGYAALSRVEGGMGSWMQVLTALKGVKFGPYGYLKGILKGSIDQAGHLNQAGAFKAINKNVMACVDLSGNAFIKGTEHNQFHIIMERFWAQFREGGAREFQKVSNKEYLQALRDSLAAVKNGGNGAQKFTQEQIDLLVQFRGEGRKGMGILRRWWLDS